VAVLTVARSTWDGTEMEQRLEAEGKAMACRAVAEGLLGLGGAERRGQRGSLSGWDLCSPLIGKGNKPSNSEEIEILGEGRGSLMDGIFSRATVFGSGNK